MNKCPRCKNENLKEEYNYCPVCGVNLRTAPEVPVQEQLRTLEFINKEFDINLSQKQYDDIAIFDLCTQKYTAYEILRLLKLLNVI